MECEVAAVEYDFDTSGENGASDVVVIINKINAQLAEFQENWNSLQENVHAPKLSLGKKLLCCLKIF